MYDRKTEASINTWLRGLDDSDLIQNLKDDVKIDILETNGDDLVEVIVENFDGRMEMMAAVYDKIQKLYLDRASDLNIDDFNIPTELLPDEDDDDDADDFNDE